MPTTHPSLDDFPLGWRFTATRLGRPAGDIVARITPLGSTPAGACAQSAARRMPPEGGDVRCIRSDDSPGAVRLQLHELPVNAGSQIVISWNANTAAFTDWSTFVAHWDDFCYPASDDVVVWAADEDWTLRYHHYEVFQFWRHPAMERDRA